MRSSPLFVDLCGAILAQGSSVRFGARGNSMAPAIRDGDLLTVVAAAPESLAPGDILLYRSCRGPLAHRLVARSGEGRWLRLKGDACLMEDLPIAPSQVLGKVVAVEHSTSIRSVYRVCARLSSATRAFAHRVLNRALAMRRRSDPTRPPDPRLAASMTDRAARLIALQRLEG